MTDLALTEGSRHEPAGQSTANAKTELAEMSRRREDLASTVKKLEDDDRTA